MLTRKTFLHCICNYSYKITNPTLFQSITADFQGSIEKGKEAFGTALLLLLWA